VHTIIIIIIIVYYYELRYYYIIILVFESESSARVNVLPPRYQTILLLLLLYYCYWLRGYIFCIARNFRVPRNISHAIRKHIYYNIIIYWVLFYDLHFNV